MRSSLAPTAAQLVQELPYLAVQEVHIRREQAARRGVPRHRTRADGHHTDVAYVAGRLLRLIFGVQQVLGAGEDQGLRPDGAERPGQVAIHAWRGAEVVPLVGPGLV